MNNTELIGKYINQVLYTDVNPIGKIIGTRGKTILILARVTSTEKESFKPNFSVGGFCAHCDNNYSQEYTYNVNEKDLIEIRWTPGSTKKGFLRLHDEPRKFYDYNF